MPKVTIALVTYNRPKYLRGMIDSILNQSFSDFEFLICDNGSDNETVDIIKEYTDCRIKYFRNDVNDLEFINSPFYLASGDYLAIVHDDDVLNYDYLQKMLHFIEQNEDIVALACNVELIDAEGHKLNRSFMEFSDPFFIGQHEWLTMTIQDKIFVPCPTVMMRRDFFNNHNLQFDFSVGGGADAYLWFMVSQFPVKMCVLPYKLYQYRLHDTQASVVSKSEIDFKLYVALIYYVFDKKTYENQCQILVESLVNFYINNLHHSRVYRKDLEQLYSFIKATKNCEKLDFKSLIILKYTWLAPVAKIGSIILSELIRIRKKVKIVLVKTINYLNRK